MASYTIICIVQDKWIPFAIDIPNNETVDDLKQAIKTALVGSFAAHTLKLYRIDYEESTEQYRDTFCKAILPPLLNPCLRIDKIYPSYPLEGAIHILVQTPESDTETLEPRHIEDERLSMSPHLEVRRTVKEESCSSAPSAFTDGNRFFITEQKEQLIYNERPDARSGSYLAIYEKAFTSIIEELRDLSSQEPNEDLVREVGRLFVVATGVYDSEAQRQSAIHPILGTIFGKSFNGDSPFSGLYLYEGYRVELSLNGDPVLQGALGYRKHIALSKYRTIRNSSCCPCVLITIGGPYISFAGAVLADVFIVEPFTGRIYLGGDQTKIHEVSIIFSIFIKAALALELKYRKLQVSEEPIHGCLLPTPTYKDSSPPQTLFFISRLFFTGFTINDCRRLLFLARYGQQVVVVKFCETYSEKAHETLSRAGLAPKLLYFADLRGGSKMIVMEQINFNSLETLFPSASATMPIPDSYKQVIRSALNVLHNENLVHGDLRRPNILVKSNEPSVMLIDFDWSGEDGTHRYPCMMNEQIKWAQGVKPNAVMKKEHDIEMLSIL